MGLGEKYEHQRAKMLTVTMLKAADIKGNVISFVISIGLINFDLLVALEKNVKGSLVIMIHPEGDIHVCTDFHGKHISIKTTYCMSTCCWG